MAANAKVIQFLRSIRFCTPKNLKAAWLHFPKTVLISQLNKVYVIDLIQSALSSSIERFLLEQAPCQVSGRFERKRGSESRGELSREIDELAPGGVQGLSRE